MNIVLKIEHETLVVELVEPDGFITSRSWVPLERLQVKPSKLSLPAEKFPSAIGPIGDDPNALRNT